MAFANLFVSLSILCEGHRIVRAGNATAYEDPVTRPAEEFRRKVRIACQAFNVLRALWRSLRRLPWLQQYMYASHKMLRWLTIYSLASFGFCFLLALLLAGGVRAASAMAGAMLCAGAALSLRPIRPIAKAADILAAFVATGIGVFRSLAGERFQTWNPPVSARTARNDWLPSCELTPPPLPAHRGNAPTECANRIRRMRSEPQKGGLA